MTIRKNAVFQQVIELFLYVFSFMLLWEWLRPVELLTDTDQVEYFIVFVAIAMIMYTFRLHKMGIAVVLISYTLFAINRMFFHSTPDMETWWLTTFSKNVINNIQILWNQEWDNLSGEFRSLLLFIALFLISYLLHYWIHVKKKLFLFLFLTILYVAILDTFSPYDGDAAMIRLIVIGFSLLGILTLFRLVDQERVTVSIPSAAKWILLLFVMIFVGVTVGLTAPKPDSIWTDPVPFFQSYSDKFTGNSGGVKKLGYSANDTKLGGGFIGDDTVVFRATDDTKHYWKIEDKNYYTGKGWETRRDTKEAYVFSEGQEIQLFDFMNYYEGEPPSENQLKQTHTVSVEFKLRYSHLPYPSPMGLETIMESNIDTERGTLSLLEYQFNGINNKLTSTNYTDGKPAKVSSLTYRYVKPVYNIDELVKNDDQSIKNNGLDENDVKDYLFLPSTVPARVHELALDLTVGESNWYDKAKAIEGYLRGKNFTYAKDDIPYPTENQDYVDQFLFESQKGYCDNFSSAMVVLLRSIDIPARWAKGYSGGTFVKKADDKSVYEVTNNNAHSWVEVFFPTVGWVPFEPTKSFNDNVSFLSFEEQKNVQQGQTPTVPTKPIDRIDPIEKDMADEVAATPTKSTFSVKSLISEYWKRALVGLLIIAIIVIFFYKTRGKWAPYGWLIFYKWRKGQPAFEQAYGQLLAELNRYGIKRKNGQTLRDYAFYVDQYFGSTEMRRLTSEYEKALYNRNTNPDVWKQTKKTWESLLKKTIA